MSASDYLGNPVSSADAGVLAAIDDFTAGFLAYETRASDIVRAARAAPDAVLPNVYAGALFMLLESPQGPGRARPFLERAEAASANAREAAAVKFLGAWNAGDASAAERLAADILAQWPRDLVMLKLHQYLAFDRGDAPGMLPVVLAAAPASPDIAQVQGMCAFAYEECHLMADAERHARRALEMTEREPWAQHALAHVLLTEGRIDEGARFMDAAARTWTGLNSFMVTHNWWHQALFFLSQGREEDILAMYDEHVWAGDKDYSQDQAGAISLLARLEMAGVDVGDRWRDVTDHVAARGPDAVSPFLALHYLYALCRDGRADAGAQREAIIEQAIDSHPARRSTWSDVAAPAAHAIVAHLKGDHETAVRLLGPVLPRMVEIGGSHAQRDLFEQIHLTSVIALGRWGVAQQALETRRRHDPVGVPLNRTLGKVYEQLGLSDLAAQASARVQASSRAQPPVHGRV